ncbi:MAG: UDP-N-acetylglucosamine 1-carboxyvinyltransferase [Planctomycetota bacterium]|nr:UDP-N-acetylglucosamine 1-carboxyvinyltransferase [Planctomycetota bacterium]
MDKFVIEGGRPLKGVVQVRGAKNAALPILAATLLAEGKCRFRNVPDLRDIKTLLRILQELGAEIGRGADGTLEIEMVYERNVTATYELVSKMRASFCVLGPLLARRGQARVSLPGGCVIGNRPIDLHLKGLRALGAEIEVRHGYVEAKCKRLEGGEVYLGGHSGSTVLGTANVMMAATLAEGETTIVNAAGEPEIQDLAGFLVKMGAKIDGAGSSTMRITGVERLHGVEYSVIPDRVEAGTFLVAGAITGGDVTVRGASAEHLSAVIDTLKEVGVSLENTDDGIRVKGPSTLKAVDVTTLPYPGFPTDIQAQLMVLLSVANGISVITEKIYPDRFMHVAELNRLGAQIRKEGPSAIVLGVKNLSGAPVMASDLRASAALVLAGLRAKGTTEVHRVYHIDRGYERIEERLESLGARIRREEE